MSWISSLIPGGDALAGAFSAYSGYQANKANLKFAKQTRDMLIQQANTTFRRGRTDMLAAGLNPILMKGGQGDPTPSLPSSAGQSQINVPSGVFNTAYQAHAQKQLTQAQTATAQANAQVAQGLPAVQQAQIAQLGASAQSQLMQGSAAQTSANANYLGAVAAAGVNKAKLPLIAAQLQGQNQQNMLNAPNTAKAANYMAGPASPNSAISKFVNVNPYGYYLTLPTRYANQGLDWLGGVISGGAHSAASAIGSAAGTFVK